MPATSPADLAFHQPLEAGPVWLVPRSAYIHIPFCSHKCGYCDFASVAHQEPRMSAYLEALDREMEHTLGRPGWKMDTIFIGGGTPTYLPIDLLQRLIERVCFWFDRANDGEFTVESNPNTVDADKLQVLADHGVTGVSFGAQSFHRHLLQRLERDHDPANVFRAVELARPRIGHLSIDLIFGVMGQTESEWRADLETAGQLDLDHCSAYGLTFEKGTRLWKQRQDGFVQPVEEMAERAMYEAAMDGLAQQGFAQYEISSHARVRGDGRDRRRRHNLCYWRNHAYFGFGVGAAGYVGGRRTLNLRDLEAYITRLSDGRSPITQAETLDAEERARETAMLNLRALEGIHRSNFQRQTSFSIDDLAGREIARFVQLGLLRDDGTSVSLTRAGLFVADAILSAVVTSKPAGPAKAQVVS